jgi:hypothetical protein
VVCADANDNVRRHPFDGGDVFNEADASRDSAGTGVKPTALQQGTVEVDPQPGRSLRSTEYA